VFVLDDQEFEIVRYLREDVDVDATVLRGVPDGELVVVAIPIPRPGAAAAPMVTAAFDQFDAACRSTGCPAGCVPAAVSSDSIEKVGDG
jgi:hypothetical protein